MDWHELPAIRWGLRQLGVVLLLVAFATGKHLLAIGQGFQGNEQPLAYFLALVGFLCFSVGGALLVHGHHLFDKVEISERWRRRSSTAASSNAELIVPEPTKATDIIPAPSHEQSTVISDIVDHKSALGSAQTANYHVPC